MKGPLSKRLMERFFNDRLAPTLGLIVVGILAAWMGNVNGGYSVEGWGPPAFLLAALVLAASLARGFYRAGYRWSLLASGLLALYTAWTFASLLWSPNRGDAWLGAGQTLLYLLAFWATMVLIAMGASRMWVMSASSLGPAAIAAFTLASLPAGLQKLFDDYRLVGSVGYYNGEAAFLLVSFWVSVYLGASRSAHPVLRAAVLAGAVLSVNLAVMAQSRGAMAAMVLSLPVFFLFSGQRLRGLIALFPVAGAVFVAFPGLDGVYLAFLNQGDPVAALELVLPVVWLGAAGAGLYGLCWGLVDRWWRPPAALVRVFGGIVLAACLAGAVAGAGALTERAGDPTVLVQQKWEAFKNNDTSGQNQSHYLSASGSGRYALWKVAWEDFAAHPVLGVGTNNYEATYYKLRERDSGSVRQAHMLPLEILAERGIVGGLLFLGFLLTCVAVGLRERFGNNTGAEGKAQAGALLAAVGYWFVHSGVEWFWQLPAVTLPAFVYLALLASPLRGVEGEVGRPRRLSVRAGGIAIAVLSLVVVAPLFVADRYAQRSYAVAAPGEALAAIERAQKFNPLDSRLPQREAELAMQTGAWARVEDSYDRAIRLNPEHYAPYMFRATYHERRGELGNARFYYLRALALNPLDVELSREVRQLRSVEPTRPATATTGTTRDD